MYEGFTVPTDYDPMLAKLIAWGADRAEAVARLCRALEEHSVTGIKTNSALLLAILRDPEFRRGEIFTRWLDERLPHFSFRRKIDRGAMKRPRMPRFLWRCCIISAPKKWCR